MTGVLDYVRNLLSWTRNDAGDINTLKRSRDYSDDDPPIMKKYRTVKSQFPKIALPSDAEDDWVGPSRVGSESRPRYIPVRLEESGPSTSTPSNRIPQSMNTLNALSKQAERQLAASSHESASQRTATSSSRWLSGRQSLEHFKHIPKTNEYRRSDVTPAQNRFLKSSQEKPSKFVGYGKIFQTINLVDDTAEEDEVYVYGDENGVNSRELEEYPNVSSNHTNGPLQVDGYVEVSDSEEYAVVLNPPKSSSGAFIPIEYLQRNESSHTNNGHSYKMATFPCKIFKSRYSNPGKCVQKNISPRTTFQSSGRFKTPHTISKPKNYTSGVNRLNASQMSEATRAAIAKSFRLDEKKDFEKLIKLSRSNFSAKNSPIITMPDPLAEARELLKKLNFNEDGVRTEPNSRSHKLVNGKAENEDEYDPITIASINLSDTEPEVLTSADDASTSSSVPITPVNSLHLFLKDKPLVKGDWLSKFYTKYENMKLEKRDMLEKCTMKNDIISKVNRDQWKSTIEKSVKADMKLPISILEDELEVTVELPELTDQQQHIINGALRSGPQQQKLIEKFSLSIHRRDIQTLAGLNWLNDEVINFYMNLLMERSRQKKGIPKVYATNTFFYPKLMQTGHGGLKRWTKKIDIFSHDLMLVPVHLGVHWCMCIIDFRDKSIKYYDSMGGKNMDCCKALLTYLEEECMDKKREKFDSSDWKLECLKKIPQQMNGSDCGMFSCTFAEFVSRDAPISFSQNDMPYLRRKMILEIVKGQLLL